jgi:AraC family transcriptional regulator
MSPPHFTPSATEYTVAIDRYAPGVFMARHAHEYAGVSLVLRGALEEDVGAARAVATAGCIVVKPPGVMHTDSFGKSGATLLSVRFGNDTFPLVEHRLKSWKWIEDFDAFSSFVSLASLPENVNGSELDDVVIELLGTALGANSEHGNPPHWLRVLRSFLDEAPADFPGVRSIATDIGVHPVYLARRFRQAYGCSVRQYRRRARLLAAAKSVITSSTGLAEIAQLQGFSDHSHMTREFNSEIGINPSRVRSLLKPQLIIPRGDPFHTRVVHRSQSGRG